MAGPTVGVLVPPGERSIEQIVAASILSVGVQVEDETSPRFDFRDGEDLPYALELDTWPPPDVDEDEALAIEEALGFRPRYDVGLIAFVNEPTSHRTLGRLAFELASQSGGWVDLGGPLGPSQGWNLATSLAEVYEYLARHSCPGTVRSLEYETASGRQWIFNVLDAEAMGAWLAHPDFHLIK